LLKGNSLWKEKGTFMQTSLDSCFKKPLPVQPSEKEDWSQIKWQILLSLSLLLFARSLDFDNPDDLDSVPAPLGFAQ
jgi:hypothetical protein